jgi:hypothetical protein
MLLLGLAFLFFLLCFGLFWLFMRKALSLLKTLIVNSVVGLVCVFLLGIIGIHVPINLATLAVIAVFGLAGLGALLVLMFFGILV